MPFNTTTDFTLTTTGSFNTTTDFTLSAGGGGGEANNIELISAAIELEGTVLSIFDLEQIQLIPATITLKGSAIVVVASDELYVVDAYSQNLTEVTEDLYYLTDSLHEYSIAAYPYQYRLVSEIDLNRHNSLLTDNTPVDSEHWAISFGHIDYSYLYDFYFRIHIDPETVDLGVIVSAQSYTVNIWNAWFNTVTLDSANPTNLPDTTLNFPYAIPYIFGALENVPFTVSIEEFGEPIIDGNFDFDFGVTYGIYPLYLQGQRAVIWPFPPLVEHTESRQWLTDVISAKNAEERYVVREIPRINLNYKFTFRDQVTYTKARALADKVTNYSMAMPYWKDARKVFGISANDPEIFVDTSFYEYSVDMIVMLFVSQDNYELLRISAVAADKITLAQSVVGNYSSCWLVPVYTGWNGNGIEFQLGENNSINCTIDFLGFKAYFDPTYWTPEVFYKSIPILTNPSIVTGGINRNYSRNQDTFDSISGSFVKIDSESYNRLGSNIRINAETREDTFILKRQMDYLQGRYTIFWLPSYQNDIIALGSIANGTDTLLIQTDFWAVHPPEFVRVHGSSVQEFEVDTVTDNLNGTSYMAFVETALATISNITRVEIMVKVRLNSDNIEYNHPDKVLTSVAVPVIEASA